MNGAPNHRGGLPDRGVRRVREVRLVLLVSVLLAQFWAFSLALDAWHAIEARPVHEILVFQTACALAALALVRSRRGRR